MSSTLFRFAYIDIFSTVCPRSSDPFYIVIYYVNNLLGHTVVQCPSDKIQIQIPLKKKNFVFVPKIQVVDIGNNTVVFIAGIYIVHFDYLSLPPF